MATTQSPPENLLDDFARLPVTKTLLEQLALGSQRKAGGLWGGCAGLLIAAMHRAHRGTMLVLTADDVDSVQLQTDLAAFGVRAHVLPREEQGDLGEPDAASRSERQRTLQHFAADRAPLIAGVEAMLQSVATPKHLGRSQFEVRAGQSLDRAQVLQRAQAAGLRAVPLVLAPGECSMRGDVVDLYPMAADAAVRLEFLDRTLESIRTFDPSSQRTTAVHERYVLALGSGEAAEDGPVLKHRGGLARGRTRIGLEPAERHVAAIEQSLARRVLVVRIGCADVPDGHAHQLRRVCLDELRTGPAPALEDPDLELLLSSSTHKEAPL